MADHIAALAGDGRHLAEAAGAAGLDAPVPSCPEWVVRDLVRHLGGVHRWATSIVGEPRTEAWRVDLDEVVGEWPPDDALLAWFASGHAALVDALSTAPPDLDCWTFLSARSPLAMWARRQAHETALHRVDAELAAGLPITPFSPAIAADGVDELLTCFITRRGGALQADPPRSLGVRCTDVEGEWRVNITAEGVRTTTVAKRAGEADCEVIGPAQDVHLTLWNRQPPGGLTVARDDRVLDLFLDRVHIRWS